MRGTIQLGTLKYVDHGHEISEGKYNEIEWNENP